MGSGMRVAWIHTFPDHMPHSGVFMHELRPYVEATGIRVDMIGVGDLYSPRRMWETIKKLKRDVKSHDIIHAQYGSGCSFVSAFVNLPKICTFRGSDWYGARGDFPLSVRIRGIAGGVLSRLSLHRYDEVVVVSRRMRRDVRHTAISREVSVIPSGIDLNRFRPIDRNLARARLGVPDDNRPWILFASARQNKPVKRFGLAQAAFAVCSDTIPEAQFKVVSGMTREQVALMMNAGDVLLLTSVHEGWPNVIKEALACNTPFVSTDVSDLAEIAAMTTTCRVEDDDPVSLGRALVDVIRANRTESLRELIEPMNMEATAERLASLYRRVLNDRLGLDDMSELR